MSVLKDVMFQCLQIEDKEVEYVDPIGVVKWNTMYASVTSLVMFVFQTDGTVSGLYFTASDARQIGQSLIESADKALEN